MSDNRKVAAKLLTKAAQTTLKDRPGVHGSAENSFQMIADMWMVYLRHAHRVRGKNIILPEDVAQMMSMLKKARAMYGDRTNDDNFVDDIGYTALSGMLQLPDPAEEPVTGKSTDVLNSIFKQAVAEPVFGQALQPREAMFDDAAGGTSRGDRV